MMAYKRDSSLRDYLVRASVHLQSATCPPPGTTTCNTTKCGTYESLLGPKNVFTIHVASSCLSSDVVYRHQLLPLRPVVLGENLPPPQGTFCRAFTGSPFGLLHPRGTTFQQRPTQHLAHESSRFVGKLFWSTFQAGQRV